MKVSLKLPEADLSGKTLQAIDVMSFCKGGEPPEATKDTTARDEGVLVVRTPLQKA